MRSRAGSVSVRKGARRSAIGDCSERTQPGLLLPDMSDFVDHKAKEIQEVQRPQKITTVPTAPQGSVSQSVAPQASGQIQLAQKRVSKIARQFPRAPVRRVNESTANCRQCTSYAPQEPHRHSLHASQVYRTGVQRRELLSNRTGEEDGGMEVAQERDARRSEHTYSFPTRPS